VMEDVTCRITWTEIRICGKEKEVI
jgi:hypothetical protein